MKALFEKRKKNSSGLITTTTTASSVQNPGSQGWAVDSNNDSYVTTDAPTSSATKIMGLAITNGALHVTSDTPGLTSQTFAGFSVDSSGRLHGSTFMSLSVANNIGAIQP